MELQSIKLKYESPAIEIVLLDNEISLALESSPPNGPTESFVPPYFNSPFKGIL